MRLDNPVYSILQYNMTTKVGNLSFIDNNNIKYHINNILSMCSPSVLPQRLMFMSYVLFIVQLATKLGTLYYHEQFFSETSHYSPGLLGENIHFSNKKYKLYNTLKHDIGYAKVFSQRGLGSHSPV